MIIEFVHGRYEYIDGEWDAIDPDPLREAFAEKLNLKFPDGDATPALEDVAPLPAVIPTKHLQGQHDQLSHGNWARGGGGFGSGTPVNVDDFGEAIGGLEHERMLIKDHLLANMPLFSLMNSETRGAAKREIAQRLAAETDLTEEQASSLVRNWAQTSNDHDFRALSLQQEIAAEFGVELSDWQVGKIDALEKEIAFEYGDASDFDIDDFYFENPQYTTIHEFLGVEQSMVRAAARNMYDETQDQFKEQGITELILYRGISLGPDEARGFTASFQDEIPLTDSNALESWTSNVGVAQQFAYDYVGEDGLGVVLAMKVPATRVFSTPRTGFGALSEQEFILFGGDDDIATVAGVDFIEV